MTAMAPQLIPGAIAFSRFLLSGRRQAKQTAGVVVLDDPHCAIGCLSHVADSRLHILAVGLVNRAVRGKGYPHQAGATRPPTNAEPRHSGNSWPL